MNRMNKIKRPSWILQRSRSFKKLWLDKNENTHPKLLKLYSKILKTINSIHISTYPDLGSLYQKISSFEKKMMCLIGDFFPNLQKINSP